MPLVKCIVNDALVCAVLTIQPAPFQFVNVMHLKRLVAGRHPISAKTRLRFGLSGGHRFGQKQEVFPV